MYQELSEYDQLLLAIEFHMNGTTIPKELADLLGNDLVSDITNPIVYKVSNNDTKQNNSTSSGSASTRRGVLRPLPVDQQMSLRANHEKLYCHSTNGCATHHRCAKIGTSR